ncbi:acyltransferase family-domain-containing protein [Chaetomium strumarium]|uniref:Acyltransferase family-domain-containing protein n=1 Tax=Chaetomium strumarium TaxID=1170767 RepID=A0AAJ0LZX5_9PEZI|nr:acyltransferase family-domain-containing protein [Chaetomium strumarium]
MTRVAAKGPQFTMSSPPTRSSTEEKRARHEQPHELGDLEALQHVDQASTIDDRNSRRCVTPVGRLVLSLILRFIRYPLTGSLRLRPTSWLDGVRGVAAMAVYLFHAMGCWASVVPAWRADDAQTSFLQLPLVRTIFVAGGGAVSVFFVLSGYVLTQRCLRLIRAGSGRAVYPAVASSAFRRGFRLYLPPILLTFCEMLMSRLGFPPPLNFSFVPEPTLLGQFWDWLAETNRLVNPLYNFRRAIRGSVTHPKYDAVIWTIPVEFYGSMVCYILLSLLARVSSTGPRMGFIAVFCVLSMAFGYWNIFCFTAGMFVADINLGQEEDDTVIKTGRPPPRRTLLWSSAFAISFYLAGFPTLVYKEGRMKPMPGFETLRALIPAGLDMEDPARFWWSVAGAVLLLSVSQLPRLRAVFDTYLCQYIAKISFSLYLVHEFCIVLFGLRLQGFLLRVAGVDSQHKGVGYWIICLVWFALFTMPVFALAAQVERWIDVPSVKFAKWLEERCLRMHRSLR